MKKYMYFLCGSLRNYFANSSLHGLRFIAEENRHWTERLLWLALCLLSWLGSALLIVASWQAYQNNAVSFVVETTYLHVNTSFPSVSVCEEPNAAKIYEVAQELFGPDHDLNLDEVLKEIAYFRGSSYYIKEFCSAGDIGCPRKDYREISNKVNSNCKELFDRCLWRDMEFDCCDHFVPRETELGTCFTLSLDNERKRMKTNQPYLSLISNRKTSLASLTIDLQISSKIYIHPDADVPFYNSLTTDVLFATLNTAKEYGISVTDIENGPELRELSVYQRKCRFPDENYLQSSDQYSYSSCIVECRRKEQMKTCNCISHLMPKSKPLERCDMNGILCLNEYYTSLSVQKTKWSKKEGLKCDCLPSCYEPEYNIITSTGTSISENISTSVIFLERFPSERYKRNVVRGYLDLVVSMGSAAGLFIGASVLSFVEIFYLFIFRSQNHYYQKDISTSVFKSEERKKTKKLKIKNLILPKVLINKKLRGNFKKQKLPPCYITPGFLP